MGIKRAFFIISMIVVLLMYAVPYTSLSGIAGPYAFMFWTLIAAAYLVFVFIVIRK